jgi:APA family basic amino acid/polyamine antiporter
MTEKAETFLLRKATGLVREAGFWDAVVYNMLPAAPGVVLALYVFWLPGTFPGSSIPWAMVAACLATLFVSSSFGLLALAMPRTAGDYVATSRILHPAVGLASSLLLVFSSILSVGYWTLAWTTVAFTPALSVIGSTTGNRGLIDLAGKLATPPWNFIIGVVAIAAVSYMMALGMRKLMRFQNILYIIAMVGLVVMAVVLISTPRETYIARFNEFANPITQQADTYQYYIDEAGKGGMTTAPVSFAGTLPVFAAVMTMGMWSWWSVAFAGEVKGTGTRRHWYAMLIANVVNYAIMIVLVLLFYRTVGENFVGAVNYVAAVAPDKYGLPMAPMLPLLVSIIPKGVIIPLLIAITFIAWTPLVHFIQMVQPIRALFAWSFDRLLPAKIAEVDERTHAPLVAIIIVAVIGVGFFAWSVWAASFFTALVLASLAGAGVMIIMGVTAIAFPYVNRQLYQSSPGRIEVVGVPLCVIAGVVTILVEAFISYFYITDSRLGLSNPGAAVALTIGILAVGVIYYYIARAIRARQGIELDYIFKSVPPE